MPGGSPRCEPRKYHDEPAMEAYCMALGRFCESIDLESQCPRREELAARRRVENVQRHKARAAKLAITDKPEGIVVGYTGTIAP